jgi:hypothetical protein
VKPILFDLPSGCPLPVWAGSVAGTGLSNSKQPGQTVTNWLDSAVEWPEIFSILLFVFGASANLPAS